MKLIYGTIKKSKGTADASDNLQKKFKLTKKQADAVLELTLKQLTSFKYFLDNVLLLSLNFLFPLLKYYNPYDS